jgi:hypothetical protein
MEYVMYIDSLTMTSLTVFTIAFSGFMQARVIRACITQAAPANSQSEKAD